MREEGSDLREIMRNAYNVLGRQANEQHTIRICYKYYKNKRDFVI